jgi:hypothetical protein
MKKKTLILVGYIFCVTSFLNSCSNQIVTSQCGTSVSTELSYTGLPSDAVFPEPRVSETSYPDKIEKIRIEFNSIEPNLTDKVHLVEMETSDQGSHWSKGSEWQSAEQRFFRYGPLVYKEQYPTFDDETGLVSPGNFQRSVDNGVHWIRPSFLINGREVKLDNQNSGEITFNFSAVDPRNPHALYGCFQWTRPSPQQNSPNPFSPGLYVSFDEGDDWTLLTTEIQAGRRLGEGCPLGISPSNPEWMIAHGQSSVVISQDGGKNWKPVGESNYLERPVRFYKYEGTAENGAAIGSEKAPLDHDFLIVKQIEFLPRQKLIAFLLTNKGLYRTVDGAKSWRLLDTGPHKVFYLRNLYIEPTVGGRMFVGTIDKILISQDLGCHFTTFFDWTEYSDKGK